MPMFSRVFDGAFGSFYDRSKPLGGSSGFEVPAWMPLAFGGLDRTPSHFTSGYGVVQSAAQNNQQAPVEMPAQEISYDDNLLTGLTDLDLDYLRQLKFVKDQNEYNLAQQNQYRNWLESMSNSAYQRQSADLRAAGYNPALMLSSGGASVPSSGYSESVGSSVPTSATGYSLKANNQILNWLKHNLQIDKYELNKNVQISKELRNWLVGIADIISTFAGRTKKQ